MNAPHGKLGNIFGQLFLGLLLTLCCAIPALADGVIAPTEAIQKIPDIPLQRSVLVYKDGLETLIIENTVNTQGDAAWIVPIPASPEEIGVSTPGLLPTLSMSIGPEIINHNWMETYTLLPLMAFVVLLWGGWAMGHYSLTRLGLIGWYIIFMVGGMFFASLVLPRAAVSPSQMTSGVNIETRGVFGSYDVAVLDADTPDDLNGWLKENGFLTLPTKADEIVSDYISGGWKFLTAKLLKEEDGTARPHPLKVSFKADKPVYPMRLTALTGSEVYLELTIIADHKYRVPGLVMDYSQPFGLTKAWTGRQEVWESGEIAYANGATDVTLAHPELTKLMWNVCLVTRLRNTLTPAEMKHDFYPVQAEIGPYQRVFHSYTSAYNLAMVTASLLWIFGLPVALLILWPRFEGAALTGLGALAVLGGFLLVSALVGLIVFASLPKTETESLGTRGWEFDTSFWLQHRIEGIIENKDLDYTDANAWRRHFEEAYHGEFKEEDSPQNYTILETDEGLTLRYWLMGGTWNDIPLYPEEPDEEVEDADDNISKQQLP